MRVEVVDAAWRNGDGRPLSTRRRRRAQHRYLPLRATQRAAMASANLESDGAASDSGCMMGACASMVGVVNKPATSGATKRVLQDDDRSIDRSVTTKQRIVARGASHNTHHMARKSESEPASRKLCIVEPTKQSQNRKKREQPTRTRIRALRTATRRPRLADDRSEKQRFGRKRHRHASRRLPAAP